MKLREAALLVHDPAVLQVALVANLCETLLREHAASHGYDATAHLDTLALMLESHLIDRRVRFEQWSAASEEVAGFREWLSVRRH
jgi:hypothetical protein